MEELTINRTRHFIHFHRRKSREYMFRFSSERWWNLIASLVVFLSVRQDQLRVKMEDRHQRFEKWLKWLENRKAIIREMWGFSSTTECLFVLGSIYLKFNQSVWWSFSRKVHRLGCRHGSSSLLGLIKVNIHKILEIV